MRQPTRLRQTFNATWIANRSRPDPSAAYRAHKFVRRNRGLVFSLGMISVVMLVGLVATVWQWRRAVLAAQCAHAATALAREQTTRAVLAERSTKRHAESTRRQLYLSDMPRAFEAWQRSELVRSKSLLARHEQDADLHGVEWSFLNNLLDREKESETIPSQFDVNGFAISKSGEFIAASTTSGTVRLLDVHKRKWFMELRAREHWLQTPTTFSPDGTRLAFASGECEMSIYDLEEDQLTTMQVGWNIEGLETSPDGEYLAINFDRYEHGVDIHRWADPRVAFHLPYKTWGKVTFSPDGHILACSSIPSPASEQPNEIIIWDVARGRIIKRLVAGYTPTNVHSFSSDGQFFAAAGYDQTIRIWDATTYDLIGILDGHTGAVFSLAFSPTGDLLASGSRDHTIRVWSTKSLEPLFVLRGHERRVNAVAFIDNGCSVVSTGYDSIRIWPLGECTPVRIVKRPTNVYRVCFTSDGRLLYIEEDTSQLRCIDIDTLEDSVFAEVSGTLNGGAGLAVSSDGLLATVCKKGPLEVWDVKSARRLASIDCFGTPAFSQCGRTLLCASKDGLYASTQLRIWRDVLE